MSLVIIRMTTVLEAPCFLIVDFGEHNSGNENSETRNENSATREKLWISGKSIYITIKSL